MQSSNELNEFNRKMNYAFAIEADYLENAGGNSEPKDQIDRVLEATPVELLRQGLLFMDDYEDVKTSYLFHAIKDHLPNAVYALAKALLRLPISSAQEILNIENEYKEGDKKNSCTTIQSIERSDLDSNIKAFFKSLNSGMVAALPQLSLFEWAKYELSHRDTDGFFLISRLNPNQIITDNKEEIEIKEKLKESVLKSGEIKQLLSTKLGSGKILLSKILSNPDYSITIKTLVFQLSDEDFSALVKDSNLTPEEVAKILPLRG